MLSAAIILTTILVIILYVWMLDIVYGPFFKRRR